MIDEKPNSGSKIISCANMPESLILNHECLTASSPLFSFRDSGVRETQERVKITPLEKDETRRGENARSRFALSAIPEGK